MDVRKVFRGVSDKLQLDFEAISSEINHLGNRGSYRENTLKNFLNAGKLPKRFGVGSGEIIGPKQKVSKQSDLIIFDQLDGMSLAYSENVQIYPIEVVFGLIEVKSKLSKEELIESLENIKSVKTLCPEESVTKTIVQGMQMTYPRPKPFGIVFAYSLSKNSLESLSKNLREWEAHNSRSVWPNLIVVLGEGVIYHFGNTIQDRNLFQNQDISRASSPYHIAYGKDSLFHFYSALIDLCSNTSLGPANLGRYFDPPEQIRRYVVKNHDRFVRDSDQTVRRLTFDFIDKIASYCQSNKKITHRELFLRQFGIVSKDMSDEYLDFQVHHYDPESLPGMHEVESGASH